jgi:hypothetical protein
VRHSSAVQEGKLVYLHPDGSAITKYPDALIRNTETHPDITDWQLRPISANFLAPNQSGLPYQIGKTKITRRVMQQGTEFIELRSDLKDGRYHLLLVDPARDFVPISFAWRDSDNVTYAEVSVEYEAHIECGWVPKHWKVVAHNNDGSLANSKDCTVTKAQINGSVGKTAFELPLPSGTVVVDDTLAKARFSIVESDGSRRELSQADLRRPYDEVRAQDRSASARRFWLVFGVFGTLTLIALLYVFRGRLARRFGKPGIRS